MSKIRIELNRDGVRQLLRSEDLGEKLEALAEAISGRSTSLARNLSVCAANSERLPSVGSCTMRVTLLLVP